ncbi:MAG TPA: DUF4870 domain-containing protein [Pseudolysinimonas sp.]|nr:DUF4870 domain-containing protein [Pseudolysinimonas sp.]
MSQPTPYSQPSPPLSPADEKTWSVLVHIGGIFFSWVAPLIGYLLLKDRGPFVRYNVVAALNFQLTLLIAYVIGIATSFFLVGILIIFAASVLAIVFGILAAIATNNGQYYRYPFAIDFVR